MQVKVEGDCSELQFHHSALQVPRSASALTGSPQYSDDFEEGDSGKEQQVCSGRFFRICSDDQCLSIYSSMIKSVFQVSEEPESLAQGKK